MNRIKLFAIKGDKDNFQFKNFILLKNKYNHSLEESLFHILSKILLPYIDVIKGEFILTAYLNMVSKRYDIDIDHEVNIRLSDYEKKQVNEIVVKICDMFIQDLVDEGN